MNRRSVFEQKLDDGQRQKLELCLNEIGMADEGRIFEMKLVTQRAQNDDGNFIEGLDVWLTVEWRK